MISQLICVSLQCINYILTTSLLLLICFIIPVHAADWFFYPFESFSCTPETCKGTQEHPWRFHPLLNRVGAVDPSVMQPGDTLYICGVHDDFNLDDRLVLDVPHLLISGKCPDGSQGTLTSYLTLKANATGSIVQDLIIRGPGVGPREGGQGIALKGVDHVTLSRLAITGWRRGIMCPHREVCNHIVVEHSTIYGVGIGVEKFARSGFEDAHWTIRYNKFYDIGLTYPYGDGEAIGIQGIDGLHIYGNQISDAKYGINMWTHDDSYIRNVTIEGNHLLRIHSGACTWPSRGIMRSNGNTIPEVFEQIVIRYNVIYQAGAQAIRVSAAEGADGNLIAHNLMGETGMECEAEPIWVRGPWPQAHNVINAE